MRKVDCREFAENLLLVFDNDRAGDLGADRFKLVHKAIRLRLPDGFKDINHMHMEGVDLPNWLCRQLEEAGVI